MITPFIVYLISVLVAELIWSLGWLAVVTVLIDYLGKDECNEEA